MILPSSRRRKKHWVPSAMPFFLFGFIYYIVSPFFVYKYLATSSNLLEVAEKYIDPAYFDFSYFLDAVVMLVSFLVGYGLARSVINTRASALDYGSYQSNYPLLLAAVFFVLVMYFSLLANASGAGFFTGYSSYNISVLGPFSTCVFMCSWFVNYFSNRNISILFFSFFVFCSALLLGWGSRMFFVLSLTALILGFVSKNRHILKSIWLYGFIVGAGLLMVIVGVLREGGGEFSSDILVSVFFAEPLFTSVTGSLYLESLGGRPVYGVPYDVFASFIHAIPSAVYPDKMQIINEITRNENVVSPFGAKALLVNLYSNFGMFYPLFIALMGFYYGFLNRRAQNSVFYRATYFSVLPIILLLFFRENLTTVLKVMFFNGLLVPLLVSLVLLGSSPRTIAEIRRRIRRDSTAGDSIPESYHATTNRP
ncbi:MAG: hypothetical protein ACJAZ0_000171 [Halioglobus sp.]